MVTEEKTETEVKEEVVDVVETTDVAPVVAPVEKTPEQLRRDLIEKLAEEIHPDCWDLRPIEPNLGNLLYGGYVAARRNDGSEIEGCGDCPECDDGCPEDCENVNIEGNPNGLYRLLIRFPEVTIRNSRDFTYPIKDFYIAIIFNKDLSNTPTRCLFAIRSTATTKEYSNGFFHPHASRQNPHSSVGEYFRWRELCLGGDTELTDMMADMQDSLSEKVLHELLVTLHIYAGWESIEGGPFQRMETVHYPSRNSDNMPSMDYQVYQGIFYKMMRDNTEFNIPRPEIVGSGSNFAISNVNDSIIPMATLAMHEYIKALPERARTTFYAYFGTYDETGTWQAITQQGSTLQPKDFYEKAIELTKGLITSDTLVFKDADVKFVMEMDENGLTKAKEITEELLAMSVMHPNYTRDLTTNYLKLFKEFKLKITL